MNIFQKVYDFLGTESILVNFARSKGEDIKVGDIAVAQKAAALVAAHGAAYLHVLNQYGSVSEERYYHTLRKIAANEMSPALADTADFIAHVTWLSGQPFRGPDYIPRIKGFTYVDLASEERVKDRQHVVDAAKYLADWLSTEPAAVRKYNALSA